MNITLKATNYDLSDDVRDLVESKLAPVEKLLGASADTALIAVEIGKANEHHRTGDVYRAEANLDTEGKLYRATAEAETLEAALDAVESELRNELRKARGKSRGLARRTGARLKAWMQDWRS